MSRAHRPVQVQANLTVQQAALLTRRRCLEGLTIAFVLREAVNAYIRGQWHPLDTRRERLDEQRARMVRESWGEREADPDDAIAHEATDLTLTAALEPLELDGHRWRMPSVLGYLRDATGRRVTRSTVVELIEAVADELGVTLSDDPRDWRFGGPEDPVVDGALLAVARGAVDERIARACARWAERRRLRRAAGEPVEMR